MMFHDKVENTRWESLYSISPLYSMVTVHSFRLFICNLPVYQHHRDYIKTVIFYYHYGFGALDIFPCIILRLLNKKSEK